MAAISPAPRRCRCTSLVIVIDQPIQVGLSAASNHITTASISRLCRRLLLITVRHCTVPTAIQSARPQRRNHLNPAPLPLRRRSLRLVQPRPRRRHHRRSLPSLPLALCLRNRMKRRRRSWLPRNKKK
ncbi:hypothetical protein M0R45_016390 [Rubus argutus]|uniref:Uncharacterized protein n=1 Tax=Rubus argutus TaxID=59490 RepID=A0AAW1XTT9_RUBAR